MPVIGEEFCRNCWGGLPATSRMQDEHGECLCGRGEDQDKEGEATLKEGKVDEGEEEFLNICKIKITIA